MNLSYLKLTSLTLPEALPKLKWLNLEGNQLANLVLPKGLSSLKNLVLNSNHLERLLVPYGMNIDDWVLTVSPNNGRFWNSRISAEFLSDAPFRIEYYLPLSNLRLDDGVEISWKHKGTLQPALTIKGPWKDVMDGGSRRLFLRSSLPAELFLVRRL